MPISNIQISGIHTISPAFDPDVLEYDVTLDYFNPKPNIIITSTTSVEYLHDATSPQPTPLVNSGTENTYIFNATNPQTGSYAIPGYIAIGSVSEFPYINTATANGITYTINIRRKSPSLADLIPSGTLQNTGLVLCRYYDEMSSLFDFDISGINLIYTDTEPTYSYGLQEGFLKVGDLVLYDRNLDENIPYNGIYRIESDRLVKQNIDLSGVRILVEKRAPESDYNGFLFSYLGGNTESQAIISVDNLPSTLNFAYEATSPTVSFTIVPYEDLPMEVTYSGGAVDVSGTTYTVSIAAGGTETLTVALNSGMEGSQTRSYVVTITYPVPPVVVNYTAQQLLINGTNAQVSTEGNMTTVSENVNIPIRQVQQIVTPAPGANHTIQPANQPPIRIKNFDTEGGEFIATETLASTIKEQVATFVFQPGTGVVAYQDLEVKRVRLAFDVSKPATANLDSPGYLYNMNGRKVTDDGINVILAKDGILDIAIPPVRVIVS